jgi:vacuolar-type H+-ATPase subunit E/Vma4
MSKTNNKNKQELDNTQGKTALIHGIEDDAKQQADNIIASAEQAKQERIVAKDNQVKAILDEANAKVKAQVESIRKNTASLISVDKKRQSLQLREEIIRILTEKTLTKMGTLVGSKEYAQVLKAWIVEAMIGLGVEKANVNASAEERKLVTSVLLGEAEADVKTRTGRKVSISLLDSFPLAGQGITVTSADGKTAFNNQVKTRLTRYQTEIRKLIYKELFGE